MKEDDGIVFTSLSYYFNDLDNINEFRSGFWKVNKSLLEERIMSVLEEVMDGDMSNEYWGCEWIK